MNARIVTKGNIVISDSMVTVRTNITTTNSRWCLQILAKFSILGVYHPTDTLTAL